ncbi:serine hydrolase domain-containing protein [Paenibacillus plantarum]|nr:serine hydrolase [Paenibacillus plantarum]
MQRFKFMYKQFLKEPLWFKILVLTTLVISIVFSGSGFSSNVQSVAKVAAAIFFCTYAIKLRRLVKVSVTFYVLAGLCLYVAWDHPTTVPPTKYWPGDEWRISTPEEQGMDSNYLYQTMKQTMGYKQSVHSTFDNVLIIKNGYLITELYAPNKGKDGYYDLYSATKSVISALVGIAIHEGYIAGLDAKVMDFFPEYRTQPIDEKKESITVGDLLKMSGGFKWDEWNNPSTDLDPAGEMFRSLEPVKFLLDKPIVNEPGSVFNYSTGESLLLSEIINKSTGMGTDTYAAKKLFEPLGIRNYKWDTLRDGVPGNLRLTARDVAKFGYLFLNNGVWNDRQIVPLDWVKTSTSKQIDTNVGQESNGYGYQWWMNTFGGYAAKGMFGQYICVLPEQDIVVVFQSHLSIRNIDFLLPLLMVENAVIKSIQSQNPLPPNSQLKNLEEALLLGQRSEIGTCGDTFGCKN